MWFEATKTNAKNEIPSSKFMNGKKGRKKVSMEDHVLTLVFIF